MRAFGPGAAAWSSLRHDLLSPLIRIPRHPILMARFGIDAVRSTRGMAEAHFRGAAARALFAGSAAHSTLPLDAPFGASFGMVLTMAAHAVGWPFPRGGSQRIADALAGCLRSHGGKIVTGSRVMVLPEEKIVLADIGPREMLALAGDRFPEPYREALANYRYGPGAFKLDWALDAPIPWRAPECLQAATVHLGGTLDEIAEYERTHTGRPFVLLTQTSLFDATRAPA